MSDRWDPDQYHRFSAERAQPFHDLVALVRPAPAMRVIDLGCGSGELTALLLDRFADSCVEGIDSSTEMLAKAARWAGERLRFRQADIAAVDGFAERDLVLSNAAFHWVPDNERVLGRILDELRPGAQVAVQVPKNEGHASHRVARELAREPRWASLLEGFVGGSEALSAERYAELLHERGFREQVCFEKIYGHELARTDDVVEWVKGTLLVPYLSRLAEPSRGEFLDEYRSRLRVELGDRAPYFYPFRRLLFWGRKAG